MGQVAVSSLIRRYLASLRTHGIHATGCILYGSFARGEQTDESDIDVIVIAPEFDGHRRLSQIRALWHAAAEADCRIEPVPCGCREWRTDRARPVLAIAREEGTLIPAD